MTLETPVTELDGRFSSPGATALPWIEAEHLLFDAGVYWLSTVRPDGRPHIAPLLAVWLDGALYFCTGSDEQKARNLARNPQVAVITGSNGLTDETDIVLEGDAVSVTDDATLRRLADSYAEKYGDSWRLPGRKVADAAGNTRRVAVSRMDVASVEDVESVGVLAFEVIPRKALGFGRVDSKGPPPQGGFSQTRWRFQASPAVAS
jgi:nitroimidazol reductase NimA-like FMN-containing flavoprotein (pyridoxamine 5'-phosphate oxidase superfamily)